MGTTAPSLQGMASNPGLPKTAPMFYTSNMILFTACDRVEAVVDGAPPGPRGRLFVVEPGKPVRVPYEAGRFILEHLQYTGVVKVNEVERTDDEGNVVGIEYDVDAAREESLAKGVEQDQMRWQRFVSDMVQDFIKQSRPVPPPPDAILAIISRRGYKMQDFGIKPIGFQDPVDLERARLKSENAQLTEAVSKLQAQMELLIRQGQGRTTDDRGQQGFGPVGGLGTAGGTVSNAGSTGDSGSAPDDDDAKVQDVPASNRPGTSKQRRGR